MAVENASAREDVEISCIWMVRALRTLRATRASTLRLDVVGWILYGVAPNSQLLWDWVARRVSHCRAQTGEKTMWGKISDMLLPASWRYAKRGNSVP